MPTVAAIGTVVGAGAAVAGQVSASKAQKKQAAQAAALQKSAAANAEEIFGSPVQFEAPEYTPLEEEDPGYAGIIGRILQGGLQNLPMASQLSAGVNKEISKATRERIEGWDPSFMGAMATLYKTRNETLKGRLPYEDALGIVADRGRLANDLGMAGGAGPQIAADLGLKRLDLMANTGPGLTASIVNILGAVDPLSRHSTPESFLLTPAQGVPMAIQDRQYGAEFNFQSQLTGAYLDAAPNPAAQGLMNLQAYQLGFGGQQGSGNGAATAAAIGQAFTALGGINWGGLFNGGGAGGVQAGQVGNSAPIYSNNGGPAYYYNYGQWNAIPKATAA